MYICIKRRETKKGGAYICARTASHIAASYIQIVIPFYKYLYASYVARKYISSDICVCVFVYVTYATFTSYGVRD